MQIIRPMHTRKSQPLGNLGQMTIYRDEVFVFANELRGKGFSEEKPLVATACQQSVFSDNLRASSSSTPRYRIVLSSFECPSKICTALIFFVLAYIKVALVRRME